MDNRIIPKPFMPIITGTPPIAHGSGTRVQSGQETGTSFQDLLRQKLSEQSELSFSKHAVSRAVERGLDLSQSSLARLEEGVRIAEQKGLDDTLILVDSTAFIVSVKNNTVITAVDGENLRGNVFTNIEGTVII